MSQVTVRISREGLVQLDALAADAKKSRNDVAGELLAAAVASAHGKGSRGKAKAEEPKGSGGSKS